MERPGVLGMGMAACVVRHALAMVVAMVLLASSRLALAAGEAVDFERPDLSGQPVRLSAFRGQWVVVNFWATWCGPCIREIPVLSDFHAEREDATVIGVNFEEIDIDLLTAFVAELGVDYPVVRAGSRPLLPFEPLTGLPSTFIVSSTGTLVAARVGEIDREWLEASMPPTGAPHGRNQR